MTAGRWPGCGATRLLVRIVGFYGFLLLTLSLGAPALAATAASGHARDAPRYTNRLIHSADPYLLLHAHNPVDWYPWGPEAIEKARREHKPIFVSIGYSTCYWCHVAERTLYSDPDIAKLMNRWFINIKVDREQRPDLDQIYMLATEILTSHGGWPNNVFLTPDLKPFFAGSYFPPTDDSFGRPGFPSVLRMVHEQWTDHRKEVLAKANRVYQIMQQVGVPGASAPAPVRPLAWVQQARRAFETRFDWKYGGLPNGPAQAKFARAPILELWLADARVTRNQKALGMLRGTLDAMALGGIHDALGGGFHRYSTERTWSVPHFEKMLYDNAQLLDVYTRAFQLTGDPLYRAMALDIGGYLQRDMSAPGGGFYTAQDAEVHGAEGSSYVWTRSQIDAALGKTAAKRFFTVYELTPMPDPTREQQLNGLVPGVLRVRLPLAKTLKDAGYPAVMPMLTALRPERDKLFAIRERRAQPFTDRKIVVALNGLAITAYAHAAGVLREPVYLQLASRAATRIWDIAYSPKTRSLKHEIFDGRAHTDAFLDDYALLGNGFLSLYEATHQARWRTHAQTMADIILERFLRPDGGLATVPTEKDLLIPPEDTGDNTYPSGTSATVALLQGLSASSTGNPRYAEAAAKIIRHVSGQVAKDPGQWGSLVAFLALHPQTRAETVAENAPAPQKAPSKGFHVPDSADHVHASATAGITAGQDEITVTLRIDPGYHVNANPASFDYLVPTAVRFDGLTPSRVVYPNPVRITPAFATEGLNVYEGTAHITSVFPAGTLKPAGTVHGDVRVQACNEQVCLPPATLPLTVPAARAN
ncbi:MAG: DUF255 domain-containing protein [Gammaproteobacteria bacterium]